jgi:hypothetical protein
MLNHLPRDPGHIIYLSCKDIKIAPEKSDEREFQFGVDVVTDLELLVQVATVNYNLLVFYPHDSLHLIVCPLIDAGRARRVLSIGGLDANGLVGVLPSFVLVALAARS